MKDSAHWLEGVLEKAGKATGGAVSLPGLLSLAEAWERASKATGIHQSELADLVALFFHCNPLEPWTYVWKRSRI